MKVNEAFDEEDVVGSTSNTTEPKEETTTAATGVTSTTDELPTSTTEPEPTSDTLPPTTEPPTTDSATQGTDSGMTDCPDLAEPNNTEETAADLPTLEAGQQTLFPAAFQGENPDWYRFVGTVPENTDAFPRVTVEPEVPIPLETCVYIECIGSTVEFVDCELPSTPGESENSNPGCCGDGIASVAGYDCAGLESEDVIVTALVRQLEPEPCIGYGLIVGL